MEMHGIDISKHNGTIDWQKVKAAGKDFAFIRLGWCGYDGKIKANGGLDSLFEANMKGAIAAGLNVGVYVYSYAKTALAARTAAHETLELIRPYTLTMPVVFDIEDPVNTAMTRAENTAICKAFLSVLQEAKYYAMIYTFKAFADYNLNMSELTAYDMWIAQWASKCTYTGSYGIWQHSATGRVNGITGDVDLNVAYRDYPDIIRNAGLNGLGETVPPVDDSEQLREQNAALKSKLAQIRALAEV